MSKGEDSIANLVRDLGLNISKVAEESVRKGLLSRRWQLFRKLVVSDFRYGPSGSGYNTKQSTTARQVWDPFDIHDFYKSNIEKLLELEKLADSISRRYGTKPAQAGYKVKMLAMAILGRTLDGMKEKELNDLILAFSNDVSGGPTEWRVKSHIEGIWLEPERVELHESTVLRKPTPEDFERELPADIADVDLPHKASCVPGGILECDIRATSDLEREAWAKREMLALQLFDVGSIHPLITHYIPASFLAISFSTLTNIGYVATKKYLIGSERVSILQTFTREARRIIPLDEFLLDSVPKDYLTMAIQRYSEALLKPDPPESRLTLAIMGLEALYLKSEERSKLRRRLSQRTSTCLASFSFGPSQVADDVAEAYQTRSTYVHGGLLKESERPLIEKTLDRILNYLRVSIIIFLQIRKEEGKESFIDLLRESTGGKKGVSELNSRLENLKVQPPIHANVQLFQSDRGLPGL
jgi:hypothetical protein